MSGEGRALRLSSLRCTLHRYRSPQLPCQAQFQDYLHSPQNSHPVMTQTILCIMVAHTLAVEITRLWSLLPAGSLMTTVISLSPGNRWLISSPGCSASSASFQCLQLTPCLPSQPCGFRSFWGKLGLLHIRSLRRPTAEVPKGQVVVPQPMLYLQNASRGHCLLLSLGDLMATKVTTTSLFPR